MSQNTYKVLVVDDESIVHKLVRASLAEVTDVPLTVEYAFDGAEAKKRFCDSAPDLVITDLMMPDMNGFDLTIFLKTSSPCPAVIVMSGTTQTNLDNAAKLGPDHVINKQDLFLQLPQAVSQCYQANHH